METRCFRQNGVIVCVRVLQILLAVLFTYITVAVAAFVYLVWWQALLVCLGSFCLIVSAGRLVILRLLSRFDIRKLNAEAIQSQSQVLQGATVTVHSVQKIKIPAQIRKEREQLRRSLALSQDDGELAGRELYLEQLDFAIEECHWYEMEVTIFPNPPGPVIYWNYEELDIVDICTPAPSRSIIADDGGPVIFDDDTICPLYDFVLIGEEEPYTPDETELQGPHRVRFITRIPPSIREVQFRYLWEQFGRIQLPQTS